MHCNNYQKYEAKEFSQNPSTKGHRGEKNGKKMKQTNKIDPEVSKSNWSSQRRKWKRAYT